MKSIVVVGAQWGDEGKGKVVDYLAASFDYIARCAGGHNAGHTVIFNGKRFVLQLIPCGILRPGKHAVIGSGVVVDPAALVAELDTLAKAGIDVAGRLHLSNRAHLIFPYHRQMEKAAEAARGAGKIGTTSRGIGPAYEDKMARHGIRVGDMLDPARFRETRARDFRKRRRVPRDLRRAPRYRGLADQYLALAERLRPLVADVSELINDALDAGRSVLFEGAQGTMLDIDFGTYPFVTSSNAISGGACTGLGVGPTRINGVAGVTKAYTTRVGSGPFPTEMPDLEATEVRDRGKEYGAVTGPPAAMRLAGSCRAALRGAHQRNFVAGRHQARRLRYAKRNSSVHRLSLQRRASQRNARVRRRFGRSHAGISHAARLAIGYLRCERHREASARSPRLFEIYFRFSGSGNRHDFNRAGPRRHHRLRRHATRQVDLISKSHAVLH